MAAEGKSLWLFFQTLDKTATKLIDNKHYDSENIASIRDQVCSRYQMCIYLCTGVIETVGLTVIKVGGKSHLSIFDFADSEFVHGFCSCWFGGMSYVTGLLFDADC